MATTFEDKTNKIIKYLTELADNDYNPLTIKRETLLDMSDWMMYVSEIQIEKIKRERQG